MTEQKKIGIALRDRGVIDDEQLARAVAAQQQAPGMPLGMLLTELCGVPVEVVDEVNVHSVLLPRFRKLLMTRLLALSRGDKFAKGLDMVGFVTSVTTESDQFEVAVYNGRHYQLQGSGYERVSEELGLVTTLDVKVTVTTVNGQNIRALLHARHDSRPDELSITDDETCIKETVYYGVRTAFRSQS